jgi:hypothetical protein
MRSLIFLVTMLSLNALLSGCATGITDGGRKVMIVNTLSATEAPNFDEIGPLNCEELTAIPDIEESCLNQLRNGAANQGASIIVIESSERIKCLTGESRDCLRMTGRAYRKKTQAM